MKKYPEKLRQKGLDLYKSGLSHRKVAKQLGVGQKTIQRWTSSAGISRPTNKFSDEIQQQAIKMYLRKIDCKTIAKKLSVSRRIVHHWLKKSNIELRPTLGELTSQWKGGASPANALIRNSKKMQEWRLSVFNRDHFTCLSCGQVGGYLEAHHILSFSQYIKLRFNVDNGTTLCRSCHFKIHGKKWLMSGLLLLLMRRCSFSLAYCFTARMMIGKT